MKKSKILRILFVNIFFINSCRSIDNEHNISGSGNINGILFNISDSGFGDRMKDLNHQASLGEILSTPSPIQKQQFVSGPFRITSELSEESLIYKNKATSQANTKPTTVAEKLGSINNPVKYRVVVYKSDGSYLGQEVGDSSTPNQILFSNLNLIGDQRYTFVTYSLGSTTNPPLAPITNLDTAELNLTGLDGKESGSDFMFAINEGVLLTGGNTTLDVKLKHKFSRIFIWINNAAVVGGGYALNSETTGGVSGSMDNFTSASIRFKDGLNTGVVTGKTLGKFPVDGITTNGKYFIINTGGENAFRNNLVFPANTINLGRDKNEKPVGFRIEGQTPETAGTGLYPGNSYTLALTFNSDRYTDAKGVTATSNTGEYVVIGGLRWDRYNLGATRNLLINNPGQNPVVIALHGNYYQWGRKSVVADSSTPNGAIAGWETSGAPDNALNEGTEDNPIKTINDPCPDTFRVPTRNEFSSLISYSSINNIGIWMEGNPTNFSAGSVYTSKRNPDIKLTFPGAGYRNADTGALNGRGWLSYYMTSSRTSTLSDNLSIALAPHPGKFVENSLIDGISIRCIAE